MRSPSPSAGKLSAKEICTLALLGALLFATKAALASLPNVNLNAVIIILSTVFFGWRALYAVGIYILLEGLIFGGNGYMLWWFGYLYTWPLLVAVCMAFRRNDSVFVWAVIAAVSSPCGCRASPTTWCTAGATLSSRWRSTGRCTA